MDNQSKNVYRYNFYHYVLLLLFTRALTIYPISSVEVFFSIMIIIVVMPIETNISAIGCTPSAKSMMRLAIIPAKIAIMEVTTYFAIIRSDQNIDKIDEQINAISVENAAPSVP